MQRPDSVWVGPFLVSITWDSKLLAREAQDAEMPALAGMSDATGLTIIMDDRLPEAKARDTLIHEILHIIWSQLAIRNVTEPGEEFIIDGVSTQLLLLFRTNPDLVAYLIGSTDPTERSYVNQLIVLLGVGESGDEGEGST